jgi:hypothetical protein
MQAADGWLDALCEVQGRDDVPWLGAWGARDEGMWIHSLGVSYLAYLGQRLGLASLAEVPAPRDGAFAEAKSGVRSDVVWFDRKSRAPSLLAEFERYDESQRTLDDKLENLILAWHRWRTPPATLLLAYWTASAVTHPDHARLARIFRDGFTDGSGIRVPGARGCQLALVQFCFSRDSTGSLTLDSVQRRRGHS